MAEGWTRAETRRFHRWCEGRGYSNGAPLCGGKAVLITSEHGQQRCQRCLKRFGPPASEIPHVTNEHSECVSWCPTCAENTRRGLNQDGTPPSGNSLGTSGAGTADQ